MIFDSHAHVFPYPGGATGYANQREFYLVMQHLISRHHQPARRVSDNALCNHIPLWSQTDDSPSGYLEVNFRAGNFGRYLWTVDGVDYQKQYWSPSLQDNVSSPEFMIAQMNYAGVDKAVLQNDIYYGKLNDYFGECVRMYPDRFIGTIHVDEDQLDRPATIAELNRCVQQLGLRGLFVSGQRYWLTGNQQHLDDPGNRPFWDAVKKLGLVVYWAIAGQRRNIRRILDEHPDIPSVLSWWLAPEYFQAGGRIPEDVKAVLDRPNTLSELCFPISDGGRYDYPYPEAQESIRRQYETLGATKLCWGSDMPNVERHCTYAQSLHYFTKHCTFMSASDKALVAGDNLARLFRTTSTAIS